MVQVASLRYFIFISKFYYMVLVEGSRSWLFQLQLPGTAHANTSRKTSGNIFWAFFFFNFFGHAFLQSRIFEKWEVQSQPPLLYGKEEEEEEEEKEEEEEISSSSSCSSPPYPHVNHSKPNSICYPLPYPCIKLHFWCIYVLPLPSTLGSISQVWAPFPMHPLPMLPLTLPLH